MHACKFFCIHKYVQTYAQHMKILSQILQTAWCHINWFGHAMSNVYKATNILVELIYSPESDHYRNYKNVLTYSMFYNALCLLKYLYLHMQGWSQTNISTPSAIQTPF